MLSNFVRHPRFEPATTGLSGKIHTHSMVVTKLDTPKSDYQEKTRTEWSVLGLGLGLGLVVRVNTKPNLNPNEPLTPT